MCKMELREQQNDSHACFVGDSSTFSEEQQGQEQQQLAENRQQQTQNRNAKKCQVLQQMRHQQHCRPHSLEKPTAIACGCPDEAISTTYCTSLANTCCAICTTAQEAAKRLLKVKTWLKRMVAKSGKKFNAWTAASETRIQSRATNCLSCGSLDDDDCSNSRSVWLDWERHAAQDSSTCCDAAVIFTNSWTSESFKLQGAAPPTILELMNGSFVSGLLASRQLRASTDPIVDEAGDAGQRLVDTADASESHKMLGADGALMWVMESQVLEQQPALPQLLMQEEVVKPGQTCVELSKQVVMPHDGCVTVNISGKAGSAGKVPAVQLWLPSATQAGLPDAGRPQYTQPLVSCNAAISTVLNHPTGGKAALLAALGASSTQSLGAGSSGKVRLAYLTIPSSPESSPLAAAEVEPSQILMPVVVKTVEHQVVCAQDGTLSFDSALVDKELHYAQLATGSPNFPALLGCAREDDRSHLVFECMSQHTLNLAKWLRGLDDQNIKCLGRDVILGIARTTAAACEHLHQQSVLHNDIKPENIVIKLGEHGAAMSSTGQAVIAGSYVVDVGGCVPEGASLQTFETVDRHG